MPRSIVLPLVLSRSFGYPAGAPVDPPASDGPRARERGEGVAPLSRSGSSVLAWPARLDGVPRWAQQGRHALRWPGGRRDAFVGTALDFL